MRQAVGMSTEIGSPDIGLPEIGARFMNIFLVPVGLAGMPGSEQILSGRGELFLSQNVRLGE